MMYYSIFLLLFFLPGFLLVRFLNIRKFTFLLSVSLSYALMIATLLFLMMLRAPVYLFDLAMGLELAILAGWLTVRFRRRRSKSLTISRGIACGFRERVFNGLKCWHTRRKEYLVLGGLLAVLLGYLGYAGPYTEIPADAWGHLQIVQEAGLAIQTGHFTSPAPVWLTAFQQGNYWYVIVALICRRCGVDLASWLWSITAANVLTFALGLFFFALYVLRRFRISRASKYGIACCAVLFAAAGMGVNVFAYIRYYAFAPAILNHVLYLAVIALFLEYLSRQGWITRDILLVPFILFAMNLIHSQEVLFAGFMMLGIIICEYWRIRRYVPAISVQPLANQALVQEHSRLASRRKKITVLLIVAAGSFFGLFLLVHGKAMKSVPEHFLVSIQQFAPFVKQMYIAPPGGQFYEVITLWGVFVYLLFFIRIRSFGAFSYILAGMLMPLLTVFNPLTVDMLLRMEVSPAVLYRFGYILPLPLVAGILSVQAVKECVPKLTAGKSVPSASLIKRWLGGSCRWLFASLIWVGLIGFLFPMHGRYFDAPYSRLLTLRRIPPSNNYQMWADMLEFLNKFRGKHIITDRVTGYVIQGYTANISCTGWFHNSAFDWWLTAAHVPWRGEALLAELDRKCAWLLVINERDGGFSVNGAVSRHWPGDILEVSRFYSPVMKAYVADHPEQFRLLWSHDRIRVYDVMMQP